MSWEWRVCCVLCRMRLGYVVVWQRVLGVACVLCVVQNETESHSAQHNFSQAQYKLPDDGQRPKHVGAKFM
jgi:hypothetical protein